MIRFRDVSFSYEGSTESALSELDIELSQGEMLAVLGANGSGKSTLARLCNGLLLPTEGQVSVDGLVTAEADDPFDIRTRVGMVFQRPDDQIVGTAVEDDVAFGPENLGLPREEIRERVDEALSAVGLEGLERREPHLLSGGQKQRLAIAGALAMRAQYLVLDEPTSMIDSQGRFEVMEVLGRAKALGQGILIITHDVHEATLADRVVVLASGRKVFEGTPEDLLGESRLESWGLELPPVAALAIALREHGVPIAGSPSVESIVGALCR